MSLLHYVLLIRLLFYWFCFEKVSGNRGKSLNHSNLECSAKWQFWAVRTAKGSASPGGITALPIGKPLIVCSQHRRNRFTVIKSDRTGSVANQPLPNQPTIPAPVHRCGLLSIYCIYNVAQYSLRITYWCGSRNQMLSTYNQHYLHGQIPLDVSKKSSCWHIGYSISAIIRLVPC